MHKIGWELNVKKEEVKKDDDRRNVFDSGAILYARKPERLITIYANAAVLSTYGDLVYRQRWVVAASVCGKDFRHNF